MALFRRDERFAYYFLSRAVFQTFVISQSLFVRIERTRVINGNKTEFAVCPRNNHRHGSGARR